MNKRQQSIIRILGSRKLNVRKTFPVGRWFVIETYVQELARKSYWGRSEPVFEVLRSGKRGIACRDIHNSIASSAVMSGWTPLYFFTVPPLTLYMESNSIRFIENTWE